MNNNQEIEFSEPETEQSVLWFCDRCVEETFFLLSPSGTKGYCEMCGFEMRLKW